MLPGILAFYGFLVLWYMSSRPLGCMLVTTGVEAQSPHYWYLDAYGWWPLSLLVAFWS